MCGIVGYIGNRQAQPILVDCLHRLEYRGYDSSGIAVGGSHHLETYKDVVRIEELEKAMPHFEGTIGIGHTRWATHGMPSRINAHPHLDCSGRIAVVHNGVISNYLILKKKLINEGHRFISETDTEVIIHLIEKYYKDDLESAVENALFEINGSYAIVVMAETEAKLIAAKKDSPLIIGISDNEKFLASDTPAIIDYTDKVIYLEDGDIATITNNNIDIRSNNTKIFRNESKILWSRDNINKGGYQHFMHKEIHEQPKVMRETIRKSVIPSELLIDLGILSDLNDVDLSILACGTSYHAGLVGKYIIEELIGIPVKVELASEFNHFRRTIPSTATIVLSQSGETADVLMAMKRLREVDAKVLVLTNVFNSTASRIANQTIYSVAGPEISVAATKTFIAQITILYILALSHPVVNPKIRERLVTELRQLPEKIQEVLDHEEHIANIAKYLSGFKNAFYVGRGINYPIALEGALKLKEIAYIHTDGFAAGELKHGSFALLQTDTPVIAIVPRDNTYFAMLTNIKEIKARNAPVIAIAECGDDIISEISDFVIRVPQVSSLFSPIVNAVTVQLLAYHTAKFRGTSIDNPRNLAKSVTVE